MKDFTGNIVSGQIDSHSLSFTLNNIKHISTQSILNKEHLEKMVHLLINSHDSFAITVNEDFPMLLNKDEQDKLHQDIEQILSFLNK